MTRVTLDPGLFPLIRHTESDAQYRVWLALRAWDSRGAGYVDLSPIGELLTAYGVTYSDRHTRRILAAGAGLFWQLDTERSRLWLTSAAHLWERLIARLPYSVTRWARPSKLKPAIDLSGDLQTFQARCYAVWIAGNTKRHWKVFTGNGFKVSRAQMSFLMKVSRPTLYTWEALTGIEVIRSEAQYAGRDTSLIPDHANLYAAEIAPGEYETRAYWRLPNTYTAADYMGEAHAARRAERRARNTAIETAESRPVETGDGERLTRYFNRGDVDTTFTALRRVARHGDIPGIPSAMQPTPPPRYAFIGYRRDGVEVWELPTQYETPDTSADERSTSAETTPEFYRLWGAFKDAMKDGFTAISCVGHRFTGYQRPYVHTRETVRPLADLAAAAVKLGGYLTTQPDVPTVLHDLRQGIADVYWQLADGLAIGRWDKPTYRRIRDTISDAPTEAERYRVAIATARQHGLAVVRVRP